MFSWVSKLSFKNKFLIIFCAFVSVIGFLLYQIEALRYDTYSFSNKELTGYKHISKLYAEIQPNLLKNKINISDTAKTLKSDALNEKVASQLYAKDIPDLILDIADKTNLTLDPDMDSYYLMDMATNKWPNIVFTLNGVNQHFDTNEKLLGRIKSAQIVMDDIEKEISKVKAANSSLNLKSQEDAVIKMKQYLFVLEMQVSDNNIDINQLEKAIFYSFEQAKSSLHLMNQVIQLRVTNVIRSGMTTGAISLMILIVVAILFYNIYAQSIKSIHNLKDFADKINDNDLTASIAVNGSDEIAEVSLAFQQMVEHLKMLISEINQKTEITASHTAQISDISHQVREGTFAQTDATQAVASAVEEIATSIAVIRDNTQKLEEETNETNKLAQENENELNDVINEVEQLKVGIGSTVEHLIETHSHSVLTQSEGVSSFMNLSLLKSA